MTYSRSLALLAIGMTAVATAAQQVDVAPQPATAPQAASAPGPAMAPLIPVHTAPSWQSLDYGIWAAGPTYKASFHDGATFIPYLGDEYPHNQPWSWRTTSVRIGSQELVSQRPTLAYDGLRATFDLGGVVEAYDVRTDGLEQTFVVAQPPQTGGDLIVRGVVTTMLHSANVPARHGELRFVDDNGAHLITYGAATAIDAAGRRRAMTTSFADGEVTLRLDAAWLADATFPLVVDPLLGPGDQLAGNMRSAVDIAHDPISSFKPYWISYTAVASLQDTDVFCHRFHQDGTAADAVFADATSAWSSADPSMAFVPSADRALLVFARSNATFSQRSIALHATPRGTQTLQTNVDILPTTGFPTRPDIGGTDNTNGGVNAMIVYQHDSAYGGTQSSQIHGMLYDASTGAFGTVIPISTTFLTDNERPNINRYQRFTPATWRVAFQSLTVPLFGIINDDWDVGVVKVADDGSASAITWVDTGNTDHKFAPQIDGSLDNYMVAYVTEPQVAGSFPTGVEGEEVHSRVITWSSGAAAGQMPYTPTSFYGGVGPGPVLLGGLAVDRSTLQHWALHVKDVGSTWSYLNRRGFRGNMLGQDPLIAPSSAVLGGLTFNHADNEFGVAYAINSGLFSGYLTMDRLARPATTPPVVTGPGCSSATIQWTGTTLIGDGRCKVRVNGAPSSAIQTLALSFGPANQSLNGLSLFQSGCTLLVDSVAPNFFGLLAPTIGNNASWDFPLLEQFPNGTTLYFQGFHTDGSGSLVFQATERLEVTIVK